LFFIYGTTATGKSVFSGIIQYIMGDYANTSNFETFLKWNRKNGLRNDIARLFGKRAVFSSNIREDKQIVEKLIKQITGGDTITARFLYQKSFEFQPKFKLFLVSDVKPEIKYDNKRMWERINQIPFNT